MPHFFEGNAQGTGFLAIVKQGTKFGFDGAGEDFAHDVAQHMHGTVGFIRTLGRDGLICQEEVPGGARASFDNGQVRSIAFDSKQHVACRETDSGVGMGRAVVEQLCEFFHHRFGGLRLFCGEFANCSQQGGIDGAGVK